MSRHPLEPPPGYEVETYEPPSPPHRPVYIREHHGCVLIWLAGIVIIAVISIIRVFSLLSEGEVSVPLISVAAIVGFLPLVFMLVCAWAIFQWKRWGVYGILFIYAAGMLIQLSSSSRDENTQIGASLALAFVVIYFFIRPNWDLFE